MRITTLIDNTSADDRLDAEHGLSFFIETDGGNVLFDTGQSDAYLDNARALGLDISSVKAIVISHGHYDHTGGLSSAIREAKNAVVVAGPGCFDKRYSLSTGTARDIGVSAEDADSTQKLKTASEPFELVEGVFVSGPIALTTPDEKLNPVFRTDAQGNSVDQFGDEICLGLVCGSNATILVGCSHRGVKNNIEAARSVIGNDKKLKLVAGGFHLAGASQEKLDSVAAYLEELDVETIGCMHCTGPREIDYLIQRLEGRAVRGGSGTSWDIEAQEQGS